MRYFGRRVNYSSVLIVNELLQLHFQFMNSRTRWNITGIVCTGAQSAMTIFLTKYVLVHFTKFE